MHSVHIYYRKIIILIVCFALTSVLVYRTSPSKVVNKQVPLSQALSDIKGWTSTRPVPLGQEIVDALELDDYVNQSYSKGDERVSLYIGYYLSTRKVGAAHSPLVCFPGQGWIISSKDRTALKIKGNEIHLLSMIVTRGQEKELVAYWFQSYDQTDPDTLSQKISLLWQKLLHEKENNAFVRVSISVGEKSLSEARDTVFEFIRSFYPVFLNYVKDNKP